MRGVAWTNLYRCLNPATMSSPSTTPCRKRLFEEPSSSSPVTKVARTSSPHTFDSLYSNSNGEHKIHLIIKATSSSVAHNVLQLCLVALEEEPGSSLDMATINKRTTTLQKKKPELKARGKPVSLARGPVIDLTSAASSMLSMKE